MREIFYNFLATTQLPDNDYVRRITQQASYTFAY